MKKLSHDEIKAMIGTEFIYVFHNRSEINCIIAAFDPDIGFTCLATELETSFGYDFSDEVDENGNLCVLGYDKYEIKDPVKSREISFIVKSIRCLGYYVLNSDHGFGFGANSIGGANPSCSF